MTTSGDDPMVRDRGDRLTRDLLSYEPPQVAIGYAPDVAGKGELGNQVARVVSRALRDARDDKGLGRAEIAQQMTSILGRSVSKDTLDQWASEAGEDRRIPVDAFIALIRATGARELLGFIPGQFGCVVVEQKFEALIQLQMIEQQERELSAYKQRVLAAVRAAR